MSLHVIEDMVESAIRIVDADPSASNALVRAQIKALYDFQEGYDCGFTHFRLMDILQKRGHTFKFAIKDHPDYKTYRELFDAKLDDIEYLTRDWFDRSKRDDDDFDGDFSYEGYIFEGELYCDVGSRLWEKMVAVGKIRGADAEPLLQISMFELLRAVIIKSIETKDLELAALWYDMGPDVVLEGIHETLELADIKAEPHVAALRKAVLESGAMDVKLHYELRPPPEVRSELEQWWWGPVAKRAPRPRRNAASSKKKSAKRRG